MKQPTCTLISAALVGLAAPIASQEFTIVALPDTQNYTASSTNTLLFNQQTQWIVDQVTGDNPLSIAYVTHLGDLVSSGSSTTQWDRADAAMDILDGDPNIFPQAVIPYSVLPGNHDYASTGNKSSGTENYLNYFGPQRFANYDWYKGADPSGLNSFQVFEAGTYQFLHIALEYQPTVNIPLRSPSPVEWAQQVITDHPGMPTIISTHAHLDDSPPGRTGVGQQLWDQIIRMNDQVIMVLGGHNHGAGGFNDGEYFQVAQNDAGNDVFELLQDFQDYPNGGNGWLRTITFAPAQNVVRVRTYSPVLDQFQTETVNDVGGFASQFDLPIDFVTRFDFEPPAVPPPPPVQIFQEQVIQQGRNAYIGTQDKEIRSVGGDSANGQSTSISVDGDDGSPGLQPNHALIRFDDIVGEGTNQIAPTATIEAAFLRLSVFNPGSGFTVYRMTTGWDEGTTWQDLGGNGITPGFETAPDPVTAVGANNGGSNVGTGTLELAITDALRAWLDGQTNFGLGFVTFTNGTNGIDFNTSEASSQSSRPALVVRSFKPGLFGDTFTQGVDGYAQAIDTQIRQADPNTSFDGASSVSLDGEDPNDGQSRDNHVLIRFNSIFNVQGGPIPTDRTIVRAYLTIDAFNPGSGGAIHRLLQDWSPSATWNNAFGGNGVQADGSEAVIAPDDTFAGATGAVQIDVTESLIAWQADPSINFGWAMLPSGNDGWDFSTAEASSADNRPQLTVAFATCPLDLGRPFDATPDADDLNTFLGLLEAFDPFADFALPFGVYDWFDIKNYADNAQGGCP